ncbi:MAG: site-2 protease family protein [Chloroflexi bacterium]|nr:site-2 protease family protein [Chloroflexota bacterium]
MSQYTQETLQELAMESSFRIARIRGIDIGVHYTWLLAFGLVSWSLAGGYFPQNYPGWGRPLYWTVGILAALMLFVSVLIHELSHSFVAQARGLQVHSITLFIFGGVSNIKSDTEDARDEFLVAVVGPISSLILAGIFWLAAQAIPGTRGPLDASLNYLAIVNLMLAVFNILPGFPLDGGRVLRAIIWGATGSVGRATRIASLVGQGLAFLFIGYGLFQILEGDFLNGLWIGFIGWFLNSAAEATRRQVAAEEGFRGVRVADVMVADPPMVSPALSVRELVDEHVLRAGRRAMPVAQDGRIVGLVSLTDVKHLPQEEWSRNSVGAIMTRPPLRTIGPREEISRALAMLIEQDVNQLLVVENGAILGMLSRGDVMRFLQLRKELGLEAAAGRR